MSHPFHKSAKKANGLPNRVSNTLWTRLKKYAHDVWEMGDTGEEVVAVRKRQETAEVNHNAPEITPGDMIVLLLGGRQLQARVLAQWDDGTFSVASNEGYLDNIDASWMEKVAEDPIPMNDGNRPSQRAITRDDMPAQNPAQPQGMAQESDTAYQLAKLLDSRQGHIAVEISPSTILEIQKAGQGVSIKLHHISTTVAHQGAYPSLEAVVQELGLKGWYQERPVQSLQAR